MKKYVYFSVCFCLGFTSSSLAKTLYHPCVLANNAAYAKYNKTKIMDMMYWLRENINHTTALRMTDIMNYVTPNVVMKSNNQLIASGVKALFMHFVAYEKQNKHVQYTFKETVLGNTKIALHYEVTLTSKNNTVHREEIIGIFSMSQNKIATWNEVVHRSG